MKQKDILLIVVIVFMSTIVSLMLSNVIFVPPKKRDQKAEVVQPITADLSKPDPHYFNSSANDPTQPITIGQNENSDPFSSASPQ